MPIFLYDKAQNQRLFEITPEQRDQLVDALEEESTTDRDYYIDVAVVEFLDGKLDAELLEKLRLLVGAPAAPPQEGVETIAEDGTEESEQLPEMPEFPEGLDVEWREE
jgi:hypothetical protein